MLATFDRDPSVKKLKSLSMTMFILVLLLPLFYGFLFSDDPNLIKNWISNYSPLRVSAEVFALYFLLCRLGNPNWARPFYFLWNGLTVVIGFFISPIILSLVYFVIITPVGLLSRVTGKKWLNTQLSSESYWVPLKARLPEDINNQF